MEVPSCSTSKRLQGYICMYGWMHVCMYVCPYAFILACLYVDLSV